MRILGLSSNYHDASAALVMDGQVVASAAEERFTLQKHDPNFPVLAAKFCLEQAGIDAEDLDFVAYHEDPAVKFSRTLASSVARFPRSLPTFAKSMREAITGGFWLKNQISRSLDIDPRRIINIPHHCSHAAHAFLTSPHEDAAVMTLDAAGEWMCSGFFSASKSARAIEPLKVIPFPHSLGLVYSSFTGFLGFKVNDGECSTMALAAFGQPRFAEEVRRVIRVADDGTYEVDLSYFDFSRDDALPITEKFVAAFGSPRPYRSELPFDCLRDIQGEIDTPSQRYADIAASIQLVLEETILRLARKLKEVTAARNLCLSGGVALNCVAVGTLIEAAIFENVYVPPDPGDGGGAMGAALYLSMVKAGAAPGDSVFHPYFGKAYDESELLEMIPHLSTGNRFSVAVRGDFERTLTAAADALADGKIVGWVQGRFENGPRALGNRSILMDPSNVEQARRLSGRVKKRAAFRPYACSVADYELERLLASQKSACSAPAFWMQTSSTVNSQSKPLLRAAMHVDGTTRPHVCSAASNPRMHRLLGEFSKRRTTAALLNTSMNEPGMPIVAAPEHALIMFLRTDMDMLVLNDALLVKKP